MIGNIKSKKTKVDFWTLEEFQKVISLLYKGDYYEHYLFMSFWLLFMTGMRIGEASALQWSDIDFQTGMLSITKTLLLFGKLNAAVSIRLKRVFQST